MNTEPSTPEVDPMVADAITAIRDRFGAEGLRDVISLATIELARVMEAEKQLSALNAEREAAAVADRPPSDDTQAWLAYTEAEPTADDDVR
jgi:hypothetical protein